jgi:hypothetical protein
MATTLVEAAQDQLRLWYPQFIPAVPPLGSAAVRAWIGRIQPFPDGKEFAGVMAHLAMGAPVGVEPGGALFHPSRCAASHTLKAPFSQSMSGSFEILALEFAGGRHPQVFGIAPEISRRRFLSHPHLRDDQRILFNGRPLQALCTYLASDGVLPNNDLQLAGLLDYTSMFLAKHLFWLSTNFVARFSVERGMVGRAANRAALIRGDEVVLFNGIASPYVAFFTNGAALETQQQQIARWKSKGNWTLTGGDWIGPGAPHLPQQMYLQLKPSQECHCGSGQLYGSCHRRQDALTLGISI